MRYFPVFLQMRHPPLLSESFRQSLLVIYTLTYFSFKPLKQTMGKGKKIRKAAKAKRRLNPNDPRLNKNKEKAEKKRKLNDEKFEGESVRNLPKLPSSMFFQYNEALGPPFRILIDTNFINFSIQNKLDVFKSLMDCLLAKCIPMLTDCVMGELEKLGSLYKVALKIAKDPRIERLPCLHKGTYADDCLVDRVTQHKCYIVATCDKELKRRLRRIPGVPIMYIYQRKYSIERFPGVVNAPHK
eukprot:gb/GEZN01016427.1/.p1 GENE.gb/GEZN01016427.1/~~gb/GEZN01016427.1/.p1  ORF type:complete len:242 (+),score=33.68 gb/GEZN01016427.1/:3-728(+)